MVPTGTDTTMLRIEAQVSGWGTSWFTGVRNDYRLRKVQDALVDAVASENALVGVDEG